MSKIDKLAGFKFLMITSFLVFVGGIMFIIITLIEKSNIKHSPNIVKENVSCPGGKLELKGKMEDFNFLDGKMIFMISNKNVKTIKVIDYCTNRIISEIKVAE